MEQPGEVVPKKRGRKRKRNIVENAADDGKRNAVATRSLKLVGRYVRKEFQGSGVFLGKVMHYDTGLYRINYEDGDSEDLDSGEVKVFLVEDGDLTGDWSERKEKLDEFLLTKDVPSKILKVDNTRESEKANPFDPSMSSEKTNGDIRANGVAEAHDVGNSDVDADSSSDSCEDTRNRDADLDMEVPLVPPPELPPSSGHIGVPEEYVSHLLSVYSFLRSFSMPLFLYPFGLDDFVGALNCSVANTLLDSIHVSLMRLLKRHLERLSSDGSELASKCLRYLDWSLLDTVTWPIYLVNYLMLMGYTNELDWKGIYTHSLERDYYTLSAGKKLIVLQILCEDVLDSEELRTEMDIREESEIGIDIDSCTMVATTCESRKVRPRYSKTSACKAIEAIESVAEHLDIKSSMESQVVGPVGNSIDEDDNGDECRLCGMDGFLVCCDGCPSSYHSRCLGLNKTFMPDGSWYCPECKINATEPEILRGTVLRGGDNFGVDPYEQVFVVSCGHLLVLKTSINSENCLRYYNRHDIPGVIHALCLKPEHAIMYPEICRRIMQYWELPENILPCNQMSEVGLQSAKNEGSGQCVNQFMNSLDKSVPEMSEVENPESCVTGISLDMPASCLTNSIQQPALSGNALLKFDCQMDSTRKQSGIIMKTTTTEQSTSCVSEAVSNVTSNNNVKDIGPKSGSSVEAKRSLPGQELNHRVDRKPYGSPYDGCLFMGSSFKPTGYINYYLHGDFAASAAANLAVLSCEENQVHESRSSDHRKVMGANIALQVKAFSSAAMRFFWPNTEKKLVEVPRERCSWCFSCKAPVASKRGCLLNAAAANAMRGATKVLAGVRPVTSGDGRLSGIATYILFMEESLSGLLVGPFLNVTFREQWRKQVEKATTCSAIKILLLELEENTRTIALSGDWMKLEGSIQSPTSHIAASAVGSTQKRRPGRRGRKPAAMVEVASDDDHDRSTDFTWWRGGTLSKLIFRKGILPSSIVKRLARQGGVKKIPGIHYPEANETPKSSRQFAWRSAVEMARNTAQLALQVRYLDFHVRWGDLVRPEQTPSDGKGPEAEASAFRNAFICDKKIVEHESRYCVAFGSQKHLPSRVMKNITEMEQISEGKERYWFSETYIPLYLIREYEQKVEKYKPVHMLPKLWRKQLKASHKNIFSKLLWKRDNIVKRCCSCHQDIFYRDAAKCGACEGFCHEQCATSSPINMSEGVEILITCKQCIETRVTTQLESSNGSPTSHLCLQGRDFPKSATSTKCEKLFSYKGSSTSVGTLEHSSEVKSTSRSAVAKKNKKLHWGLIWRKKSEDTGIDFRLRNILLRGNPNGALEKPLCRLCNQPYNADLMYIRCETCEHWFHADAVELDESKIFSLVGFKCSKCRRIRSPVCPYLDPEKKKVLEGRQLAKLEIPVDSGSGIVSENHKEEELPYSALPRKAEVHATVDDPLLVSLSEVEQCSEDKSEVDYGWNNATVPGPGPKKLPVRSHIKQDKDVPHQAGAFQFELSAPFEAKSTEKLPIRRRTNSYRAEVSNPSEENACNFVHDSLSPQAQFASKDNFDDGITLDYDCLGYDDMEFEPQTYFSFNELLASDDGGNANGNGSPENVVENWESSSVLPENGTLEISYDQEEPIISVETTIQIEPCKICSNTEPCPDLSCQICGLWLHRHCSPWFESSSWEDGWRCGNCREWR